MNDVVTPLRADSSPGEVLKDAVFALPGPGSLESVPGARRRTR